jgi:hypothetical protein
MKSNLVTPKYKSFDLNLKTTPLFLGTNIHNFECGSFDDGGGVPS